MPNLSDHKLYGKRILHVCSPVRWSGSKAVLETDSNWKVLMDTVMMLPMCHHYILIPERSTIQAGDPLYSMNNVTLIPFPYPQSVLSNRSEFNAKKLKRIFSGKEKVFFRPSEYLYLETSSIDIDFVFCHQPEILSNVLWALLTLRYGMNNTDGITFFHWVDCPASAPAGLFPPTLFRHMEAVNLSTRSFVHGTASLKYWKQNWNNRTHVVDMNDSIEDKLLYMPLTANSLPTKDYGLWKQKGKPIAFNHRWHTTTGRDILPEYMEGLPPEYVVYCTDQTIKKPQSGQSPVGDRFKYAYDSYKGRPQEKSTELYSDFLKNCYASVGIIKGYGTWNLSVQDPIQLGTPTLVYDTPMMRDVLGSQYPLYFKTKEEFQTKLQKLPENFEYKLRDFKTEFENNLMTAMLESRNHTKVHDQEGLFGGPWLYFMSQGLTYKKDLLYQTHQSLVDGQGSNSWETIRRWVKQWGVKDDPTSPFTKLHIPDDATEAHRRLQEYVNDEEHENPVSKFEKLHEHKEFHKQLNKTKIQVDLTEFF
tara:strand:+ start:69 stop:1667 length:1599 start_codon:yes stop_codon:yes gene_type:complete